MHPSDKAVLLETRRQFFSRGARGLGIAALASLAAAHHSISAEFDTSQTVTFNGTICSVEFYNPHSYLNVHVKLPNGQAETWRLQLVAPHLLAKGGLFMDSFKPGDSIAVEANASKTAPSQSSTQSLFYSVCTTYLANSLRSGYAREMTLSSGKQVAFGVEPPVMVTVIRQ